MFEENVRERTAEQIAENGMKLVQDGNVRNHKLLNTARIHFGEEELEEVRTFRTFLTTKNCCRVMELVGADLY